MQGAVVHLMDNSLCSGFPLQAQLTDHLPSTVVLTFSERKKIFCCSRLWEMPPSASGMGPLWGWSPLPKLAANQPMYLRAWSGSGRARNEEEEGGGETSPCLVLQAKVHLVQLYCATSLSSRWTACPRRCRAVLMAVGGNWLKCSALQSATPIWGFFLCFFSFRKKYCWETEEILFFRKLSRGSSSISENFCLQSCSWQ